MTIEMMNILIFLLARLATFLLLFLFATLNSAFSMSEIIVAAITRENIARALENDVFLDVIE